jgi:hypothetical protein
MIAEVTGGQPTLAGNDRNTDADDLAELMESLDSVLIRRSTANQL